MAGDYVNFSYGRLESPGSLIAVSEARGKTGTFLNLELGLPVGLNVGGEVAVVYKLQERTFAT
ncbi:hypothetical protein [Kamptonema formosum]|uniref:hypothetical protein n=1 Tax=Kamptonema formosum TaxID=331992 RepID=UPI000345008B|nr:hypothetical protein [Oscillatoria sp. PCC 10802]